MTMIELTKEQRSVAANCVDWVRRPQGDRFVIGGLAGCLHGDTEVLYNRGRRTGLRRISLRDLYLKFNGHAGAGRGPSQRWEDGIVTRMPSMWPDGTVRHNAVVAVFESGIKPLIRVKFSSGVEIVLTADHPVATAFDAYVKAGDLRRGDIVLGRGSMEERAVRRRPLSERPKRIIVNLKYHPFGAVKVVVCNGLAYRYTRVSRARLVYEAHLNKMKYSDFVYILKHDPDGSAALQFLARDYDVHHVDDDTLNDDIKNLIAMKHAAHAEHHATESSFNKDYIKEHRVVRIEQVDPAMTYDVQMTAPANNFCANGLFVHNTGKSTVLAALLQMPVVRALNPIIAAPTGKAANVLRNKGLDTAGTVHSKMYKPQENPDGTTTFVPVRELRADGKPAGVMFVDEASMVTTQMLQDVESYRVPIVYVGDYGQLEPVGDDPEIMKHQSETLRTIHRQALDSPIVRFAHSVREGHFIKKPVPGVLEFGDREYFMKHFLQVEQAICGFNAMRVAANKAARKAQKKTAALVVGDRLICLRNNGSLGLFNGMSATVEAVHELEEDSYVATVRDDGGSIRPLLRMHPGQFNHPKGLIETEQAYYRRHPWMTFWDYASCITAHKSQGSEFESVLVLEEIASSWEAARWRYTVATRAKRSLKYCR